jgi:hypothetical protein
LPDSHLFGGKRPAHLLCRRLYDRLDALRLQPVQHTLLQPGILERKPAFSLVEVVGQHVLEIAESAPPADGSPQLILQPFVLDGDDKVLHIPVPLVGIGRGTPM